MHLARLGVSALQSRRLAPRTWLELFWLADGNYQGPAGLSSVIVGMWTAKSFVSSTFVIFSLTCLTALVTPIVLTRAYPVSTVDVQQHVTVIPNAMAPSRLEAIDAYAQLAIGSGAWTSGMTVDGIYNTSVFTPAGVNRDGSSTIEDFFFAGDVSGADVILPGIRVQGSCNKVDEDPFSAGDTVTPNLVCQAGFPGWNASLSDDWGLGKFRVTPAGGVNVSAVYCMNTTWGSSWTDTPDSTGITGYIWFDVSNGTFLDVPDSVETTGLVTCHTMVSTGNALLNGRQGTYESFNETMLYNASQAQSGEPLLQPLYAAIWNLQNTADTDEAQAAVLAMLDYVADYDGSGSVTYTQPSVTGLAAQMWKGATHMAAAVSLAARRTDQVFPGLQYDTVSGRIRNDMLAAVSFALLGLWALLLLYCTVRMFRPTFGDSLASYVPARLALDRPELVGAERSGQLADNGLLRKKFGYVDKTSAQVVPPHVQKS
ncbi:hypothetical protein PUNSTDRAFT_143852 [Punctularia strigosozonata HHB-11173 SS5]|uniref:uncharacterized protein n=1 Tax=Punctularia strigosozonata (strain HHB-11173) TaxID=741275 RepID=UPI000441729C|nr:uncharacterized protein PUNSTDRAFT_143852 [Punctularia strigosozonata HHB-11173 SS5]EIN08189.1 hypothetical protein PUNSTDRAFT_143852 [Punctularia strigosozonata HHB-11173 SS5]